MELDDMGTLLWSNVNQRIMKYYLVTKNADKDETIEESWKALKGDLDALDILGKSKAVGFMMWGVEMHRKGRKGENKEASPPLVGKAHIHMVIGVGSTLGEPVKEQEIRYFLRKFLPGSYVDIKVNELKDYKNICKSLGYIVKEYRMEDVDNNLRVVGEERRIKVMTTSGIKINDIITNLRKLGVVISHEEKEWNMLIPFTRDKHLLIGYNVINYLRNKKMRIDKEGNVFEEEEGMNKSFRRSENNLEEIIIKVSKTLGIMEPLTKEEGINNIKSLLLDSIIGKELKLEETNRYLATEDRVIDVWEGRSLSKESKEFKGTINSIRKKVGEIDYPTEFIEYVDKSIRKEDKDYYVRQVWEMMTGRKKEKRVPYIMGEGGTGKTLIFRELMEKVHGDKLMIVTPNQLRDPFGLESLLEAKALVLEEFHKEALEKDRRSKALMMLEGGELPVNRKFKSQKKVKVDMPLVVISNIPLKELTAQLDRDKVYPLLRRVKEIVISPKDLEIEDIYEQILEKKNEIMLYVTGEIIGIKGWDNKEMRREEIFNINKQISSGNREG